MFLVTGVKPPKYGMKGSKSGFHLLNDNQCKLTFESNS